MIELLNRSFEVAWSVGWMPQCFRSQPKVASMYWHDLPRPLCSSLSTLVVVAVHAGLECARHPVTHKHPRVHRSYAGCSALHSVFPRFCCLSSKVWLFLVAVWKENSSRNRDVMTDTLSANRKTNQVECTSSEGCSRTRSLSKAW